MMSMPDFNDKIDRFLSLFQAGVDAWMSAGELIVELVENDPHAYDYIIERCPTMNSGILGRFEQMGRKLLHPQLMMSNAPGLAKLKRLPFSVQERFITESIPLVVHTENGTDVLLVQAKDLTKEQAQQVFSNTGLRTMGEQKARLIQQRSNAVAPSASTSAMPYVIKGGKAIIGGVEFSQRELLMIAGQLAK